MSVVPTSNVYLCSAEDVVELASAVALAEAVASTETTLTPPEETVVTVPASSTIPENTVSSTSHADPSNDVTGSGGSPAKHNESQTSVDVIPAASLKQERTSYEGPCELPFVEGEVYQVERIINRRVTAMGVEYRVKWLGYPSSENTWEPESNLDCPEQVAEFLGLENPEDLNFSNDESDSEYYGPVIFEIESTNKEINLSKDIDENMGEIIDKKTDEFETAVNDEYIGKVVDEIISKVVDENMDKPETCLATCINEKEDFEKFVDVNMAQPEAHLANCGNEDEKIGKVVDENMNKSEASLATCVDESMNKPEAPLATCVDEKENFGKVVDVSMGQPDDEEDMEKPENIKMDKLENVTMELTENVNMDESGDIIMDEDDDKKKDKSENETMMIVDTEDDNDNSVIVNNGDDEDVNDGIEENIDHSLRLNDSQLNRDTQFQNYLYDMRMYEGKEPNKIISSINDYGETFFLIKWKNSNYANFVPSTIAKERWPSHVLAYYKEPLLRILNSY